LFEGVDARAITIQREQYGGTVHLFIGMGHNPNKNTFMTLTCTHNRNINHQGLTSLFFFDSPSCLTFVATLSRSCRSSTLVVVAFKQCLRLEDLRRRRSFPTRSFSDDEAPIIFISTPKTMISRVFRTIGRGRPLIVAPRSISLCWGPSASEGPQKT
jgi:hypothetical protein